MRTPFQPLARHYAYEQYLPKGDQNRIITHKWNIVNFFVDDSSKLVLVLLWARTAGLRMELYSDYSGSPIDSQLVNSGHRNYAPKTPRQPGSTSRLRCAESAHPIPDFVCTRHCASQEGFIHDWSERARVSQVDFRQIITRMCWCECKFDITNFDARASTPEGRAQAEGQSPCGTFKTTKIRYGTENVEFIKLFHYARLFDRKSRQISTFDVWIYADPWEIIIHSSILKYLRLITLRVPAPQRSPTGAKLLKNRRMKVRLIFVVRARIETKFRGKLRFPN